MKYLSIAALALALSACSTSTPRPRTASIPVDKPASAVPATRPPVAARGLEAVMGKDSTALIRLFGQPRLDVIEVQGRKLQFVGKACILDAFLYPDGKNGTEAVTHIDARRTDGAAVDKVQCVNALSQR